MIISACTEHARHSSLHVCYHNRMRDLYTKHVIWSRKSAV